MRFLLLDPFKDFHFYSLYLKSSQTGSLLSGTEYSDEDLCKVI